MHLPNGGFNVVKFGEAGDVRAVIALVTTRLSTGTRHYGRCYALRAVQCVPAGKQSQWIHQDTTMAEVQDRWLGRPGEEWRFELRVRYPPPNLKELHDKDKVTFYYYYDQVGEFVVSEHRIKKYIIAAHII